MIFTTYYGSGPLEKLKLEKLKEGLAIQDFPKFLLFFFKICMRQCHGYNVTTYTFLMFCSILFIETT